MGSPLGHVLANLSMSFHQRRWLDQFQFCEVLLNRRYVNDIICLFNSDQDADVFFKFLNTHHPYNKYTFGKQKDDKLAFLDVRFSKTNQKFCISIFCKMTSIVLLILFFIKLD